MTELTGEGLLTLLMGIGLTVILVITLTTLGLFTGNSDYNEGASEGGMIETVIQGFSGNFVNGDRGNE